MGILTECTNCEKLEEKNKKLVKEIDQLKKLIENMELCVEVLADQQNILIEDDHGKVLDTGAIAKQVLITLNQNKESSCKN